MDESTSWPDVALVAVHLAFICLFLWLMTRD
jgi:hypothetical protein